MPGSPFTAGVSGQHDRRTVVSAAALFALVTFLLRAPFLGLPFGQQDEGYYASIARATAVGSTLYADMGYVRPPGLNLAYRFAWWVSDTRGAPYDLTLRVFAGIVAALTVAVVAAYLFRRFSILAAVLGSSLAAVLSALLTLQNEANAETWMMLPYTLSGILVLLYVEAEVRSGRWRMLLVAAGLCTGLACMFKEVALVNLGVPLMAGWTVGRYRARESAEATGWFACGTLAVFAVAVLALLLSGQASHFLYHTWLTRFLYVADTHTRASVIDLLLVQLRVVFGAFLVPLLAAAAAGVVALTERSLDRQGERRLVLFALGWVAVSMLGVAASGRFYEHYFIQAITPLAMLLAASVAATRQATVMRSIAVALAIAACVLPLGVWATDVRRAPDLDATRRVWRDLAERVDDLTPDGGTLLVWGDTASVRAYSRVLPATDVAWAYYPLGDPGGDTALGTHFPSAGDRLIRDLERPPDTIVVTAQLGSYLPGARVSELSPRDDQRFEDLLLERIASEYQLREQTDQYLVFTRSR